MKVLGSGRTGLPDLAPVIPMNTLNDNYTIPYCSDVIEALISLSPAATHGGSLRHVAWVSAKSCALSKASAKLQWLVPNNRTQGHASKYLCFITLLFACCRKSSKDEESDEEWPDLDIADVEDLVWFAPVDGEDGFDFGHLHGQGEDGSDLESEEDEEEEAQEGAEEAALAGANWASSADEASEEEDEVTKRIQKNRRTVTANQRSQKLSALLPTCFQVTRRIQNRKTVTASQRSRKLSGFRPTCF